MNNTVLQIPLSKKLREQSEKVAADMGFSSLQEVVRVFLNKLICGELTVSFDMPVVKISDKNAKRYQKIVEDYEKDRSKYRSFNNVNDMMKYLNDDKDNSRP